MKRAIELSEMILCLLDFTTASSWHIFPTDLHVAQYSQLGALFRHSSRWVVYQTL